MAHSGSSSTIPYSRSDSSTNAKDSGGRPSYQPRIVSLSWVPV